MILEKHIFKNTEIDFVLQNDSNTEHEIALHLLELSFDEEKI